MNWLQSGSVSNPPAQPLESGITSPRTLSPATPKQKRGGKALNITKRASIWYFKKTVDGRCITETLETTDKQIAIARARGLAAKYVGKNWEEIDGIRTKKVVATIGEVLEIFRREAARLMKEETINGYCWALSLVVRRVHGEMDVAAASTELLTEELITKFEALTIGEAGDDAVQRERAKRSARSTLISARAVFAKWTQRRAYQDLHFPPSFKGFKEISLGRVDRKSYRLPPGPLIDKTLSEGHKLKETQPELYPIFLLCYYLGLRAGEAAACRWDWFAAPRPEWGQQRMIEILCRPDFVPKRRKERRIPVNEELWTELTGSSGSHSGRLGGDYVLRGDSFQARRDRILIEFAHWMRAIGWHHNIYTKAAHELRKLMGSRWYTELGAEVAQEWLGHESVATTCSFYAGLRRQPKALGLELNRS